MSTVTPSILPGDDPLEDMQRTIMEALTQLLDGVAGVYDYVPEPASGPYVTWGTAWLAERDALNGTADRVWFQLDVWSEERGYREAVQVARKIVQRLHHAQLIMPGYDVVHVLREQVHTTRDPDGQHRRVALTFNSPYVSHTTGG
jgi:hypothetical protein